jgi:uncharacterized protein YcbK (DUF882 family)
VSASTASIVAAALLCMLSPACSGARSSGVSGVPQQAHKVQSEPEARVVKELGAAEQARYQKAAARDPGPGTTNPGAATPSRFFFSGDGRLRMTHAHFKTTIDVRYRRPDGTYDARALAALRHFFRSREDGREGEVSLRLIELLDYVEDRYRPKTLTLASGYRSPAFNENLRSAGAAAARASLHTQGLAADVSLGGVKLKPVWIDLRERRAGGAGYYRSGNFLHLDTGPPRFWEETTSRVSEDLSADNARIFLRTDFDRYDRLDGALLDVHSITAFPLRLAPQARVTDDTSTELVTIQAVEGAAASEDGCLTIAAPADAYRFRVAGSGSTRAASNGNRHTVVLSTCEPRVGKTPAEIVSNPIAIGS